VTAEAVRNLTGFLEATGWTCLYGIGMGTNTPGRAAAEAEYVAKMLGDRLQYFQIGNEVDLFSRHLRNPQTWNAKTYLDEWLAIARAVTKAVPHAKFGLPDVAANVGWLTQIAEMWPSIQNPPNVTTLTHHYYFGGPATNPEVSIPNLLKPATMERVQKTADIATAAADKMGVRVRMTEGNTCYRGGKPGVSDVFAAALWSADYSLLLASNNYSGVNLHGGTGKSVANSVGGFLPGDVLLKDAGATPEQIASHPHPFYSPIATFGDQYTLEPVACGLKFAGALCGATLVKSDLTGQIQPTGVDATAYAAKLPDGSMTVVILNKDASRDLELTLDFGAGRGNAVDTETLSAPALDAREAHIAREPKLGALKQGKYAVTVPHASGLRVTVH
jgi:Glycosyl hydrolase family 30 beta sandwich domain